MSITPGRPYCTTCMDEEPVKVVSYRPRQRQVLDYDASHQPGGVVAVDIEPSVLYRCSRDPRHGGEVGVSDTYVPPTGTPRS